MNSFKIQVILGIIFPPLILFLDFRIGEELKEASGNNEDGKEREDDTKSSKVPIISRDEPLVAAFGITAQAVLTLVLCYFQDVNADLISKKDDEEEGDNKQRRIPIGLKIYEFYNAPFTKFWFNTVRVLHVLYTQYKAHFTDDVYRSFL